MSGSIKIDYPKFLVIKLGRRMNEDKRKLTGS